MQTHTTIQIAHRSTLLCEVLREALEHRGYQVPCYTTTGQDTLAKLKLFRPSVIILSNTLEGISGIEIAETIHPGTTESLFLSQDATEAKAVKERIKVAGHLPSFVRMSELFFALQEITNGRTYVSSVIEDYFLEPANVSITKSDASFLQLLTQREIEVMRALAESYTTPQIADKLFISTATVNNHRANIMQKLDLKGRNQLMGVAIALKPFYNSAA